MALPNYTYTPPPIIGGATTARRPGFASQETLPLQGGVYDQSGFFGDVGRSFQIGALQGKEMVTSISMGIGSGLLRKMGEDDLADTWDIKAYQMGAITGSNVGELERQIDFPTRLNQIDSVGGFFKYGMYAIAKQAPQLASQFAISAVAGLVSGGTAAVPTFLATSYILGAGEVYSAALADTGDPHLGPALAAGVPIALLDTLPMTKFIAGKGKAQAFGNWMSRNIKGKWNRRFIGAMETSVMEGTTEAVQNIFEQMAVSYAKEEGWDLAEMIRDPEFAESGASGAWVGFPLGFIGSSRGRPGLPPAEITPPKTVEEPPPVDPTTQEAAEALRRKPGFPVTAEFPDLRAALKEQTRKARVARERGKRADTRRDRPGFVEKIQDPTYRRMLERPQSKVQEDAELALTAFPSPTEPLTEVLRTGAPGGPEIAPVELPRSKDERQKDLDTAYEKQQKRVDGLRKVVDALTEPDSPTGIRTKELFAMEYTRLQLFGLEAAAEDLKAGRIGRTKDGKGLPEFIDAIRGFAPTTEDFSTIYGRVQNAVQKAGLMQTDAERASFSDAKRLLGMFEVGKVERGMEATERAERAAVKETERVATEARAAIPTELTGVEDLSKSEGIKRITEVLNKYGVTKADLGITGRIPKFSLYLQAVKEYVGVKQWLKPYLEAVEASRVQKEAEAVVDEIPDDMRKVLDKAAESVEEYGPFNTRATAPLEEGIEQSLGKEYRDAFEAEYQRISEERAAAMDEEVTPADEEPASLQEMEASLKYLNEALAFVTPTTVGRGEDFLREQIKSLEAERDAAILAASEAEKKVERAREVEAVEEAVAKDKAEAEAAREIEAEDFALLIRDTMEKPDGQWKSIEKDEITLKDLSDLGSAVGVSTANKKFSTIYNELREIEGERPFSTQELETLALLEKKKKLGKPEKERLAIIKRREAEAREPTPKPPEQIQWDLMSLVTDPLSGGIPGTEGIDPEMFSVLGDSIFLMEWMTKKEVAPKVVPVPEDDSQIWYQNFYKGKSEASIEKMVSDIVYRINGEVHVQADGKLDAQGRNPSYGIRLANYLIDKQNDKRQKIRNQQNAKLKKAGKEQLPKLVDKKPYVQMINYQSSKPLEWDPQRRTSAKLRNDIENQIKKVYEEPQWAVDVKKGIHDRLQKNFRAAKIKETGKSDYKLTEEEIEDLNPEFVSRNGRYVLRKRKWVFQKETKVSGKKISEMAVRKTKTQKTGLLVAYNSNDEIIGIQDFNEEMAKMAMSELDFLRAEYGVVAGSHDKTWSTVPKERIAAIFVKYGIPMKGSLILKDTKGKTLEINMSDLPASVLDAMLGLEGLQADFAYSDHPDSVFNGFSTPPRITKVFIGKKEDIPSSLQRFMKYDSELEAWVHKEATIRQKMTSEEAEYRGIERDIPRQEAQEREFSEAFSKLTKKQQKKFTESWGYASPEIKVVLRAKERKASLWNSIPIYPLEISPKGEVKEALPYVVKGKPTTLLGFGKEEELPFLRTRDVEVPMDKKGPEALEAFKRFLTDPKKYLGGKILTGKITNFTPALYEENKSISRALGKFWTGLMGEGALLRHENIEAQMFSRDKISEETIELTDDKGEKHIFSRDDILVMDEVTSKVIDPKKTEITQESLVTMLRANLVHGRERQESFLQRMSDPMLRISEGGLTSEEKATGVEYLSGTPGEQTLRTAPAIAYYIQPETISVGSKVSILSENTTEEIDKNVEFLYANRERLRLSVIPERLSDAEKLTKPTDRVGGYPEKMGEEVTPTSKQYAKPMHRASREEIKELYLSNRPWGGLEMKLVEDQEYFKKGDWIRVLPPEEAYRKVYQVERIDTREFLGDTIYLEGLPNRPIPREDIQPVHFPAVAGLTARIGRTKSGVSVVTEGTDQRVIEEYEWEKRRQQAFDLKIKETGLPKELSSLTLKLKDLTVGDAVRLRPIAFDKRAIAKEDGEPVIKIIKEGYNPILKEGRKKGGGPYILYVVSDIGNTVKLSNPSLNEEVIEVKVKYLSPSSLNSVESLSELQEIRDTMGEEGVKEKIPGGYSATPWEMFPVDMPPTTSKGPIVWRQEGSRWRPTQETTQLPEPIVPPGFESSVDEKIESTRKVQAGLYEITTTRGNRWKVERVTEEDRDDHGEWLVSILKPDVEYDFGNERIWEWDETVDTLKRAKANIASRFETAEGLRDFSGQLRVAPTRRWMNEYGISIEEHTIDQRDIRPDSFLTGFYYEVYRPSTDLQSAIAERFYDPDDPVYAFRMAKDKYGGKDFYDSLTVSGWLHKERTRRAQEMGYDYPIAREPVSGFTLDNGSVVKAPLLDTEKAVIEGTLEQIYKPGEDGLVLTGAETVTAIPDNEDMQNIADAMDFAHSVGSVLTDEEENYLSDNFHWSEGDKQHSYSLVLEDETTAGEFPQRLIGGADEVGTTSEELFDALIDIYGKGIFNIVKIVGTQDQLPPTINADAPIRAVTFNNTVWMVAENITLDRVIPVAMHEIGAHGFQSIMGRKAYMSLLGEIARMVHTDPVVRQAYMAAKTALKKTHPNANTWLVLEETLAYYVEANSPTSNTFWNTLFQYVLRALHRLKIFFTPRMKGWQVMFLVRSALHSHVEATKGDEGKARVFMANFLDTPLYQTEETMEPAFQDPDAEVLSSMLPPEVVTPAWMEREAPHARGLGKMFKVNWVPREAKKGEQLTFPAWMAGRPKVKGKERFWIGPGLEVHRALFNYFAVIEAWERGIIARGGTISTPPTRAHGAYKNVVNEERKRFRKEFIDPFTRFAKESGIDTNDLHSYMYAKHAPFENRVRPYKDRPSSGIWSTIAEATKDGDRIPSAEGLINELKLRLTGKVNIGGKEMTQYESLEVAAQMVYRMSDHNLTIKRDGGLITQNYINYIMGQPYIGYRSKSGKKTREVHTEPSIKFPEPHAEKANPLRQQWAATYVPLKGSNINDTWTILGDRLKGKGGFGIKGPEFMKRVGRQSPTESVWAWSIQNVMDSIDRVEKNKVDFAFANMVWENRELLNDQMLVIKEDEQIFYKRRDPNTKRLWLDLNEKVQTDPRHVISFKIDGIPWSILVKDNRIGRAFNRTNVMETNQFLDTMAFINRYFALINTTLSPEFILTNFSRDYQTALHNLLHEVSTRKGLSKSSAKKLAKKVTRNAWKATRGMHQYITKDLSDTEWSALAKEMSEAGGRIDFYGFKNAKDVENRVSTYIKDMSRKGFKKYAKTAIDWMSDINASVENTMRLATYAAVKEEFIKNGMTESEAIAEAADVSRNLTVNFTMKGEKTPLFNSLYLFFNAGTAGSFRAMTSYSKSRKVRMLAKGLFAMGLANSFALYFLGGDDEDGVNRYAKIPMDQRHRNMYIYIPGADGFAKFPLAYGFNLPYVLADTVVAMGMGQINPWEAMVHVVTSTMQTFMPMDVANSDRFFVQVLKTASPTALDSAVDLAVNEKWSGNPITPEPFPGTAGDPPAYRAWSSTSEPSKFISDWMNRLTGPRGLMPGGGRPRLGTKYERGLVSVSPTMLDYFYGVVGGSLGRFFKDGGNMMVNVWARGKLIPKHKEDLSVKWNEIPMVRRFWTDEFLANKWNVNDRFNAYREEIGYSVNFARGIVNDFGSDSPEWKDFKKSHHYDMVRMDPIRKSITGSITKLYKARAAIRKNRLLRNDIKEEKILEIEKRIMELKKKFNIIFDERMDRGIPEASPVRRLLRAAA